MSSGNDDYDVELLSQGGYGCVYYPALRCNKCEAGIDCKTKFDKQKYVSKIQVLDRNSSEYNISRLITEISNFQLYFAPIVNICKIDLSRINEDSIDTYGEKCGIIQKYKGRNKQFVMLHIPYIKNGNINDIIKKKLHNGTIFMFFLDTYRHVIVSLKQLLQINVIHYDLKLENLLYNNEKQIPVIIDFGLSIDFGGIVKNLKLKEGTGFVKDQNLNKGSNNKNFKYNKYKKGIITSDIRKKLHKMFYVFAPDYYLWSLEITFITFLLHGDSEDESFSNSISNIINGTYILNNDDVMKICHKYIYNNKGLAGFDDNFISNYFKLSVQYYNQFVGLTSDEIIYNLLQYWWSWDNYSISIMYLKLLFYTFDVNTNKTLKYLYEILLLSIHPNPDRRYLLSDIEFLLYNIYYQGDTLDDIKNIFNKNNNHNIIEDQITKDKTELITIKKKLNSIKTTNFNVNINKI